MVVEGAAVWKPATFGAEVYLKRNRCSRWLRVEDAIAPIISLNRIPVKCL